MKSLASGACRLYLSGLALVLLPAVALFAIDPVAAANGFEAGDDQARAAHGDRMGDDGLVLLRVPLGPLGGAVPVLIRSSDLRAAARAYEAGFVLLSMEEAATFRGTRMPGCCKGTGVYNCYGDYDSCSFYTAETCPSWVIYPTNQTIRYCWGWTPCPPPTRCKNYGKLPCHQMQQCVVDPKTGACYHPWWYPTDENEKFDDVCLGSPQPVPPDPVPAP